MSLYRAGLGAPVGDLLPGILAVRLDPLREISREIGKTRGVIVGLHERGAYNLGIRGPGRVAVGQWVATPGYIKSEIRRLVTDAKTVGREIQAHWNNLACSPTTRDSSECGRLNDFIVNVWTPYMDDIVVFAKNHRGFFSRFWGSTIESINERRDVLVSLRAKAQELGVGFRGPIVKGAKEDSFDKFGKGFLGVVKWVILAVAVVAGLWVIAKLVMEYR